MGHDVAVIKSPAGGEVENEETRCVVRENNFFLYGGGSKWHPRSNVAIIVIREDSGGECSLPVDGLLVPCGLWLVFFDSGI